MHPESEHDILKLDLSRLETLGVVFNSIVSMMLGFCIYGRLSTLRTDARFLKELLEYDRPIAILTRSVYFASRYLCIGYLVAQVALIDGRRHVSCAPISLLIVATFYLLLIFNHWLFASRLLAVWHGHAHRRFIQAYIGIGFVLLVATVVVNFSDAQYGNTIPQIGCIYLVNWLTYPREAFQITLCSLGLVYHTINMTLAMTRLSAFRNMDEHHVLNSFSWKALTSAIASVLTVSRKNVHKAQQRRNLAQDLIEQGFHYWVARTILVSTLVFLPSFAFSHITLAATIGFAVFTVADVELSGLLYRATVNASRRPSVGALSTLQSSRAANDGQNCQSITFTQHCVSHVGGIGGGGIVGGGFGHGDSSTSHTTPMRITGPFRFAAQSESDVEKCAGRNDDDPPSPLSTSPQLDHGLPIEVHVSDGRVSM